MDYGKEFERRIIEEISVNATCTRIPNAVMGFYSKGRGGQKKTPFDFALGVDGFACFFDAKACGVRRFNFKSLLLRPKKIHQYHALQDAGKKNNMAGLLIWFYNHGWYSWASVSILENAILRGEKGISYDYPGVVSHRDDRLIDIRELLSSDMTMKCYGPDEE